VAQILDEVATFSAYTPLPVQLNLEGKSLNLKLLDVKSNGKVSYYHAKTGIKLIGVAFNTDPGYSKIAFRGQVLENPYSNIPFVNFFADLLSCDAQDVLTINRNEIKDDSLKHVDDLLVTAITEYLISQDAHTFAMAEEPAASAFLLHYNKEHIRADIRNRRIDINLKEIHESIATIGAKDNFHIYIKRNHLDNITNDNVIANSYTIDNGALHNNRYKLPLRYWKSLNGYIQHYNDENGTDVLHFSKSYINPFSDTSLKNWFISNINSTYFVTLGGRISMPVWKDYSRLASKCYELRFCYSMSHVHMYYDHFILPFFFQI
jgi:hypothetical protein